MNYSIYFVVISACHDIRQPRKFSANVVDVFDEVKQESTVSARIIVHAA